MPYVGAAPNARVGRYRWWWRRRWRYASSRTSLLRREASVDTSRCFRALSRVVDAYPWQSGRGVTGCQVETGSLFDPVVLVLQKSQVVVAAVYPAGNHIAILIYGAAREMKPIDAVRVGRDLLTLSIVSPGEINFGAGGSPVRGVQALVIQRMNIAVPVSLAPVRVWRIRGVQIVLVAHRRPICRSAQQHAPAGAALSGWVAVLVTY